MLSVYQNYEINAKTRENVSRGVKFEQNLSKRYKFQDTWN